MKMHINNKDFERFRKIHKKFVDIKYWTKEKHDLCKLLKIFLSKFHSYTIYRKIHFPKFSNNSDFLMWDYEIVVIPENKRGFFLPYRNKEVFILCVGRSNWGRKSLLVILSKGNKQYLHERVYKNNN